MARKTINMGLIRVYFSMGNEETKKLIRNNFEEILEKSDEILENDIRIFYESDEQIKQKILDNFSLVIKKLKNPLGHGIKKIEAIKKEQGKPTEIFDEEYFAAMMFGKYGEEKCSSIAIIIKELMKKSHGKVCVEDIKKIGEGATSKAILVGDYVFKFGKVRNKTKIRNNPRILQPIVRRHLLSEEESEEFYIEVQNAVENNWTENLSEYKVNQILYKVYKDFRKTGQVWTDVKIENVGRLLKPNRINYTFRDIDGIEKDIRPTEEATGIKGEILEEEILDAGEYVVLDSDYIYEDSDAKKEYWSVEASWFEQRYQREKLYSEMEK